MSSRGVLHKQNDVVISKSSELKIATALSLLRNYNKNTFFQRSQIIVELASKENITVNWLFLRQKTFSAEYVPFQRLDSIEE